MGSQPRIVDITPAGNVSFLTNVTSFLEALNPLGAITDTVGKIIACRVEMRRLQVEAEEIRLEYIAKNRMIDGTMEYAMRRLEAQRIGMERYFDHASKQLDHERIYNSRRVAVMEKMTTIMVDRSQPFEVKVLAQETIIAMSRHLIDAQANSSASLSVLVEASSRNLLSVPSFTGLLPAQNR